MKINKQGYWYRLLLAIAILSGHINAEKRKRQIFREQVLPALGGKIPEEAFRTDRLTLNRLNKEGVIVPDGVILDARHVHKHPHPNQRMPEIIKARLRIYPIDGIILNNFCVHISDTLKVYLTSDDQYVPPEGRSHYNHPRTVDTTYIIRKPFRQFIPITPPVKPGVYTPIVTPLVFPADTDRFDLSNWRTEYEWDTGVYEPFDDYFVKNLALFDSHQINTNYQGFLNEFHGRSLRHVKSTDSINQQHRQDRKYQKLLLVFHQKVKSNIANFHDFDYTSITNVPEINFPCCGRKEMLADIEMKCQIFHNSSDGRKHSHYVHQELHSAKQATDANGFILYSAKNKFKK